MPSNFTPNLENSDPNRPKRRHVQPKQRMKAIQNRTVRSAKHIIEKVKEEQTKYFIYISYLNDYSLEEFEVLWLTHYRALKETIDRRTNPRNWNFGQVAAQIVKTCKNPDLANRFKEQEIDGSSFLKLKKEDLLMMGLQLDACIKISTLIELLRELCITH